jgi:hypothetical protein
MRPAFPDYELPDHENVAWCLSEIHGDYALILRRTPPTASAA